MMQNSTLSVHLSQANVSAKTKFAEQVLEKDKSTV